MRSGCAADPDGRFFNRTSEKNALGFVTTFNYDNMGFLSWVQNALGHLATTLYNAARQKTADQDPLGNLTTYGYDSSGRVISVTDARGNVSSTIYNARSDVTASVGRFVSEAAPSVDQRSPPPSRLIRAVSGAALRARQALGGRGGPPHWKLDPSVSV